MYRRTPQASAYIGADTSLDSATDPAADNCPAIHCTVLCCAVLPCPQASAYIGADTSLDSATDPAANIILPGDGDAAAAAAAGGKGSQGGSSDTPVLPVVPFEACINMFAAAEVRRPK